VLRKEIRKHGRNLRLQPSSVELDGMEMEVEDSLISTLLDD
jgi:hypothetical protein